MRCRSPQVGTACPAPDVASQAVPSSSTMAHQHQTMAPAQWSRGHLLCLRRAGVDPPPRERVLSDEDYASVIQAALSGAEWAWTALYRDLAPRILRYLRAHGAREPEDVLGEVFVLIVRNLPRFEGGGREFRAWAFTHSAVAARSL